MKLVITLLPCSDVTLTQQKRCQKIIIRSAWPKAAAQTLSRKKQAALLRLDSDSLCSGDYRAEILSLLTDRVTLRHPAIKL